MKRPVYELTVPQMSDPNIEELVKASFDFMTLSEMCRDEAVALQHSFMAACNAYGADKVSPKILRKAHLHMRAASAFEIMHRDPDAFKALFKEVSSRG
jgi:hypothetical protein